MDLFLLVQQYSGAPPPIPEELVVKHIPKASYVLSVPRMVEKPIHVTENEVNFTLPDFRNAVAPKFIDSTKLTPPIKTPAPPPPPAPIRPPIKKPIMNLHKHKPPAPPPPPPPPAVIRPVRVIAPIVDEVIETPDLAKPNLKVPISNLQRQFYSPKPVEEDVEPPELVRPLVKPLVLNLHKQIYPTELPVKKVIETPDLVKPNLKVPISNLQKQVYSPEPPGEDVVEDVDMPKPNLKVAVSNLRKKIYSPGEDIVEITKQQFYSPESPGEQLMLEDLPEPVIEFKPIQQKLECVALLTTSFEVANGRVERFFDRLQLSEKYDLDFIIFLNKGVNVPGIETLTPYFNNIFVISTEIAEKDDVRVQSAKGLEYGGCSGPNILFLKSMNFCERYNTTLVLETDCFLQPSWLDSCINYVKYSGSFLVAGSNYHGKIQLDANNLGLFEHINGVAFYNTSNKYFKILMDTAKRFIIFNAVKGSTVAYDVAIYDSVVTLLRNKQDVPFWTYIHHNIIRTTLIVNISLPIDASTPLTEVLDKFPMAVIIHKKD